MRGPISIFRQDRRSAGQNVAQCGIGKTGIDQRHIAQSDRHGAAIGWESFDPASQRGRKPLLPIRAIDSFKARRREVGERSSHLFPARSEHDGHALDSAGEHGADRMAHQRLAAKIRQQFRPVETRARAGREDEGVAAR